MRPLLSEFSYGYALTEELASGVFGSLIGAPIFPSLIQEGRQGGGYDLQLPLAGSPLFVQFKLSDCMVYRSAKEWSLFNREYYRMHLRPSRHSDQHSLLQTLENAGEQVYYVAPLFHTTEELNTCYSNHTVASNSVWFRPSDIGSLPDDDDHYIAFNRISSTAYFCSDNPRPINEKRSKDSVERILESALRNKKEPINRDFFKRIADEILDISKDSKESAPQFENSTFKSLRRGNEIQEANFASFLARSILNAELFIVYNSDDLQATSQQNDVDEN